MREFGIHYALCVRLVPIGIMQWPAEAERRFEEASSAHVAAMPLYMDPPSAI